MLFFLEEEKDLIIFLSGGGSGGTHRFFKKGTLRRSKDGKERDLELSIH